MKTLVSFVVALLLTFGVFAQNNLNEGFEGEIFPPVGWTLIPSNDITMLEKDSTTQHSGSYCIGVYIENFSDDDVTRWVITPCLSVNNELDSIAFWFYSLYEPTTLGGVDSLFILVSTTTNDQNSFLDTIYRLDIDDMSSEMLYQRIAAPLSNYQGQNIYVAVVMNDDLGFNWFYLDDFSGPAIFDTNTVPNTNTVICESINTLPFTEDFESYSTNDSNAFPQCWSKISTDYNTYLNTSSPYVSPSTSTDSQNLMFIGMSDTNHLVAIMPRLADSIDVSGLQITFDYKSKWTAMNFAVGVMTDSSDLSTFTLIDTIRAHAQLVWQTEEISFNAYQGTGKFIAFYLGTNYTNQIYPSCFIDNISLDYLPSCPKVTLLAVNSISPSSATISFSDASAVSDYNVYYKSNTDSVYSYENTTDTFITLSSLSSGTTYTVYVVSRCSGEDSAVSSSIMFTTPCEAVENFPYFEGFENGLGCWMNEYVSGVQTWQTGTVNYTTALEGANVAYVRYCPSGVETRLAGPVFNISNMNEPMLKYGIYISTFMNSSDSVAIQYQAAPDSAWTTLKGYTTTAVDAWIKDSVALPSKSSEYRVAFLFHSNYEDGLAIDSILLFDANPTIIVPCNDTIVTLNETICADDNYVFNGENLSLAGTYYDTVQMASGCDSITILNLSINPVYDTTIEDTIKNNHYEYNDEVYSESGTYTINLQTEEGCDSIVTLILHENSSIENVKGDAIISLYPNPTKDNIILNVSGIKGDGQIRIIDINGREVMTKLINANDKNIVIDISSLNSGAYYMNVITSDTNITKKFIKN